MLGGMDKHKRAPGVAVASIMEKIAKEITPLFAEGKVELGGNRVYHETRDHTEMDFTDIFIHHQRKWYSFSRRIFGANLDKSSVWFFEIDSTVEKPIKEKIEILFKKYQAELFTHKIKAVLR